MGNAFLYGNGSSGGKGAELTVTAPAGSTVTVSKDGKSKTKVAGSDGIVVFKGLQSGTWTLTSTDGEQTASKTVEIVADYATEVSFNVIPEFTYTGDYEIVNDADEAITASQDNWKIRLLTSGTLNFTDLRSAENGIDVFLVGGGGGGGSTPGWHGGAGGGGGYTTTGSKSVSADTSYPIVIGAGGSRSSTGGDTSAFDLTASGGKGGSTGPAVGGDGGSGGGGSSRYSTGGAGGSDGGNGGSGSGIEGKSGGSGQGSTTREFGGSTTRLYAGGGGAGGGTSGDGGVPGTPGSGGAGGAGGGADGGKVVNGSDATANTGGGGGGAGANGNSQTGGSGGSGGSGIVIIRNKR